MSRYLLDVNILAALHWPRHIQHQRVMTWFRGSGEKAFSTCALTQAGFLRIMSNPVFLKEKIKLSEARQLLGDLTRLKGHTLWPINIDFLEATKPFHEKMQGHRQVTDAYLLGLAIHEKGTLVTLDKAIRHLAGDEFAKHILLIGENA